jgi:hypothetical protein
LQSSNIVNTYHTESQGGNEMPAFKTEVPHQLGKDEAVQKLPGFVESASQRFQGQVSEFEGEWIDATFRFKLKTYGFKITGEMAVEEATVRLEGTIPFAAMPFKGKIEKSFAAAVEKTLA